MATALIGPLAWEPLYAEGVALEKAKIQKKKGERERTPTTLSVYASTPARLQA